MKQLPLTIFAAVLLAVGTTGHGAGPLEQLAQAEGGVALANGGLRLNEILASNRAGRLDDEGQTSDWVEIYNPGNVSMRLGGYRLTNDPKDTDKWAFPNTRIPAGGYRGREGHLHELCFDGSWSHRNLNTVAGREKN